MSEQLIDHESAALQLALVPMRGLTLASRKLVLQALWRLCLGEDDPETQAHRHGARSLILWMLGAALIEREKAELARMAVEDGRVRFEESKT